MAILLFTLGAFFSFTAMAGCFGGCCRLTSFLTFYIWCLAVNIVFLGAGGVYSIVKAIDRQASWKSLTLESWIALEDKSKDFVQQAVLIFN